MAIWKLHLPEVLKTQMISDEFFFFRIPQHLFGPQHHPAVLLKTAISGRLFVRQAIQAKCTQVPRSFLDFEHLTQEKRQQAEPAMARWHLMAGWLDVMDVKWCKLLLVLVIMWCIFFQSGDDALIFCVIGTLQVMSQISVDYQYFPLICHWSTTVSTPSFFSWNCSGVSVVPHVISCLNLWIVGSFFSWISSSFSNIKDPDISSAMSIESFGYWSNIGQTRGTLKIDTQKVPWLFPAKFIIKKIPFPSFSFFVDSRWWLKKP